MPFRYAAQRIGDDLLVLAQRVGGVRDLVGPERGEQRCLRALSRNESSESGESSSTLGRGLRIAP